MAESGGFTEDDFKLTVKDIQHRGDDDDDKEVNTTRPFQPGAASTPYHGGEEHEMQTMMHEQSGLPSYDETTPLIADEEIQKRLDTLREDPVTGLLDITKIPDASVNPLSEKDKEEQIRRVKRLIRLRFPNANVDKLVIRYSSKNPMDIVVLGPLGVETKIVSGDDSALLKRFIDKAFVKKTTRPPPAKDVIQKTSDDIKKRQKELKDLRDSEQFLRSKNEEIQNLNESINKEQAKIEQLKETPGLDNKKEIKRIEQLKKNLELKKN